MLLFVKNVAFWEQKHKKKCIAKTIAIHLEYYFFSSS